MKILKVVFLISFAISYNCITAGDITKGSKIPTGIDKLLSEFRNNNLEIHSLMILQDGNTVFEKWFGEYSRSTLHIMNSISKTFTATAIGFAVDEGTLNLSDKVMDFFPEFKELICKNKYLGQLTIMHLLTMTSGHATDPTATLFKDISLEPSLNPEDSKYKGNMVNPGDWEKLFFSEPLLYEPGTKMEYNSLGTYMLSSIIQRVTGIRLSEYLDSRLFKPLGIDNYYWHTNPAGVDCGGWGLYLSTESMAKFGQFILQKGNWNGKQLINPMWFDIATYAYTRQPPAWSTVNTPDKDNDWAQGYGFQMWRCRYNSFRADGAFGQYIIIMPDYNAVIITTANIEDMMKELNIIWDNIPACHDKKLH